MIPGFSSTIINILRTFSNERDNTLEMFQVKAVVSWIKLATESDNGNLILIWLHRHFQQKKHEGAVLSKILVLKS